MKAVFIDRDGTINKEKHYVHKIADLELISCLLEALRILTAHHVSIYIITNQAGITKGLYSEAQFHVFTEHMLLLFSKSGVKIEKVLYCPHHPEATVDKYRAKCECRKPGTKLIEDVMREKSFSASELALIGDNNTDIEAGASVGLRTYLVRTGYGMRHVNSTSADYVVDDLLAAAKHICCPP